MEKREQGVMASLGKKLLALLFMLILSGIGLCAYFHLPYDSQARTTQVDIPKGESFVTISRGLAEKRLLRCPRLFSVVARVLSKDRTIMAGAYRLHSSMSPREILEGLSSGLAVLHRITVPEGVSLDQVARILEAEGVARAEDIQAAGSNPAFFRNLGIEGDSLEGYLFPDTYYLPLGQSANEILTAMVRQFWRVYDPQMRIKQIRMGWRIHDVVTLASIIEKEASRAEEKPYISSVLHNRLARDMPLQCDPTVIYGIRFFDGNLKREDLLRDSAYNTYLYKGLPPGPICNPGLGSLQAALNPADTPYLYFVSKNDGTHQFSESIEEHNRAVHSYQKETKKSDRAVRSYQKKGKKSDRAVRKYQKK